MTDDAEAARTGPRRKPAPGSEPDSQEPFQRSGKLRDRAHAAIPGGSHTYAKGDDQFPELSPGFISHGRGCRVWDVDGNKFIEYGMGVRSVSLGHAYPPIVEAVRRSLELGTNFGRPHPLEVECAEAFLALVPSAEMVKFTKDGSTATSAAVKLARAATAATWSQRAPTIRSSPTTTGSSARRRWTPASQRPRMD